VTSRRWWPWVLGAVAANTLAWAVFLLREPLPPDVLAAADAAERKGVFHLNSSAPYLIARRPVARGASHGSDTVPVEGYQWISLPGLLAGFALHDGLWRLALTPNDATRLRYTAWPWATAERRSWTLASTLYAGTTAWWGIVGFVVAHLVAKRVTRRRMNGASGPDNNEMQQTSHGPSGGSLLISVFCGPLRM
jgi:hypothetical protein